MSLREVLESYKHIELSDDEYCEAMIQAKIKKEEKLKQLAREKKAEETRKNLTSKVWSFKQTHDYMIYRAGELFGGKFVLDEHNEPVFNLLCHYFSSSDEFVKLAVDMDIDNPSLDKSLLLCGNYGVGKTWLMSLFRKNNKRVYQVEHSKRVASLYKAGGIEALNQFLYRYKNAFNDPSVLYQEYSGLCIEDIGREDVKGNYGDRCNVIEEIIDQRYINNCLKGWFHGTTNLTVVQLKEYYGGAVTSRLRESCNLIELNGPDRRK